MSVNYTHPVDMPVTDLDLDDEVLFRETTDPTFINTFDYEQDTTPSFVDKAKKWFSPYIAVNNTGSNAEFDIDSNSDSDDAPPFDLRDYKINRLNRKVNQNIIVCIVVFFVLGSIVFFRPFSNNPSTFKNKLLLSNSTHNFYPTTIMVSLDGFHPHYISPHNTPTLHNMLMNEYGAPFMVPSFPSSTFPNHWTLITGLYPSEHGIVGNTFYDPKLNKQFINTNPKVGGLDPDFWQGGEPLWKTAEKNDILSAVHMWPGSEVPQIGPQLYDKYNGSELLSLKVARITSWLDRDIKTRPELILSYVPTIDQYGHKFGISGQNLTDALTYVDDFVDLLLVELKRRNLDDIVNVVIVSDHGMAPTSNDRLLFLDDIVDLLKVEHVDGWPLFGLRPYADYSVDDIFADVQDGLKAQLLKDHYHIYKLEDVPEEWHFGGKHHHKFDYRLAPVWIVPDVGFSITTHAQFEKDNLQYLPRGVHGYNNTEVLMRAIFLGKGPHFTKMLGESKKVKPFANTEVYQLVCESLNMSPAPNNSTMELLSTKNVLPDDWTDSLAYPDVPYEIEHIVKDATYDLLWHKVERLSPTTITVSTNTEPYSSLLEEEATLTLEPEKLPKPTDFSATAKPSHDAWSDLVDHIEDAAGNIGSELEDVGEEIQDWLDDLFDDNKV